MPRTCPITISSTAGNIMSSMKERGSWRQPTVGPGHLSQWSTCHLHCAACPRATTRSPQAIARTRVLRHGRARAKATNITNTTISPRREHRRPDPGASRRWPAYRARAFSCRPTRPEAVAKEISMMRLSRLCMSILLLVLVLGSVTAATAKAPPPSGTLTISTTSVAVGIGVNWGTGTLTTHGTRYPFALQGLEVGGEGGSKVRATGQVYHRRQ